MNGQVFVNRILNMKKIKWIGLDMDHTLIRYNTEAFESLVYQLVIDSLVAVKGYPSDIKLFEFHFENAIRGLIVDSKNGNILKLSRYGAIRQSYHGTRLIDYAEQKNFYRSHYVDLKDRNYMVIDTSFSIAFCVLYEQLVDYKDANPTSLPDYAQIATDVLGAVDLVHADGSLKSIIRQQLDKYVLRDPRVVEGLLRQIRYGKRIFILTNSDYFYSKVLLDYAITPFLPEGKTWQDIFEYVITLASKPRFFYDNPKFLKINPEDGSMMNTQGHILPGIYQGGCARKFTSDLDINGDEILYIGDHIYGDILRLKKDCNWRTALVVEELGKEIQTQMQTLPLLRKVEENMQKKTQLENDCLNIYSEIIDSSNLQRKDELNEYHDKIADIDKTLAQLLVFEQSHYNPKWGRVFRAGAEESYFAQQVDRFACIYMEKLTDLLEHSPMTYFRSKIRPLAHETYTKS